MSFPSTSSATRSWLQHRTALIRHHHSCGQSHELRCSPRRSAWLILTMTTTTIHAIYAMTILPTHLQV